MKPDKKTIMIADDSALNRELLTEILGNTYDYVYAEDGEQALSLLSAGTSVDILLLDMNMPRMSGMDVLKIMNLRNRIDEIPVVIISAEDDLGLIQNAYDLGATEYIVRPFNAFLVRHRVANTLTLYAQNKRLVKIVESQIFQREKVNNILIHIFSHVVEYGNRESGSHTLHVQTITGLLLNRLCRITDKYPLSEADISMISSVAALHDIGKITIPNAILNKPGKLTEEEWKIMQTHTVKGDAFLSEIPIDGDEPLMKTAHEICRWHHERYDGSGYPDGLVGDEIPISAQVVALADVYDALTGKRCYKRAFSHETAVSMILNGECGAFNPLLLQCFRESADELIISLRRSSEGYRNTVQSLTTELLTDENMCPHDRSSSLVEYERVKKEFFAAQCKGIQFEYDALLGKLLYIDHVSPCGKKTPLAGSSQLLADADQALLREKLRAITHENPYLKLDVRIPVNGTMHPCRLSLQTIWAKGYAHYIAIVGHLSEWFEHPVPGDALDAPDAEHHPANVPPSPNIQTDSLLNYYQDTLEQVYTRAYFEQFCKSFEEAQGVAVLSISDCGKLPDDTVLQEISKILRRNLRKSDVVIRYNNDEFLMIFTEIAEEAFYKTLRRIKRSLIRSAHDLKISIGGAHGIFPLSLAIKTADKKMYQDKYETKE